ncbi:MAG: cupin domain-containing protein, partial [Clostridia bacterium]|nr:cupin domain-containing protein [Clostridia bacterium]
MDHRNQLSALAEVAARIREMRSVMGFSPEETADKTGVTVEEYLRYERGEADIPFTFIHKCTLAFGVELADLLEGQSAKLSSYTVTRAGEGQLTAREDGIEIRNLAPLFRNKLAEPHWVKYEYSEKQQKLPIHCTTHSGQEFDLVLQGSLKVQVGGHTEILREGDSILYNSSTPHGMIAVDGKDCVFCAVVIPGETGATTAESAETISAARSSDELLINKFIRCAEDEKGRLKDLEFVDEEKYNFAFDTIDAIAEKYPDKLA